MVDRIPDAIESERKDVRRIVVVYEDTTAREHAINVSPQLAESDSPNVGFEIHWCPFEALSNSTVAGDTATRAARAEIIIFAVASAGDLPQEIKLWIEDWIYQRSEREGTVVGLVNRPAVPGELACLKEIYLRHAAHRAGMDYLSSIPGALLKAIPDSLDSYSQRAGQVTAVLDEILHTHAPPPGSRL